MNMDPGLVPKPENSAYCNGLVTIDYLAPRGFRGAHIVVPGANHDPSLGKTAEEVKNTSLEMLFANNGNEIGDYLVAILETGQDDLSYFTCLIFHDKVFICLS